MGLEAFLRIWCRRGTQGLEADWLKPAERKAAEPAWRTAQRDRMREFAGPELVKPDSQQSEVIDVTARRLG